MKTRASDAIIDLIDSEHRPEGGGTQGASAYGKFVARFSNVSSRPAPQLMKRA